MTKCLIGRGAGLRASCRLPHFRCGLKAVSASFAGNGRGLYVIRTRDWVNVIPITSNFEMVLVNQYRFGVQKNSWEIPGGVMEAEKILSSRVCESCRKRRILLKRARLLGSVRPNPAIQNNACHIVLAEKASKTADLQWDEHEEISTKTVPIERVFDMVQSGEIFHALVLNALLLFYPEWEKSRLDVEVDRYTQKPLIVR